MIFPSLRSRRREAEWMDAPDVDPRELQSSLRFIRRINTLLGYTRATLAHVKHFGADWKPGERITFVDLATGSADIPRAILRWAVPRGLDVHVTGIDRHAETARTAQRESRDDPRLRIVQADVMRLPFADRSFDYALTAMFLHHLDDEAVVHVLREMDRISRRGIVVADLLRHRRAYAWISLFTIFANPMVRHDARVSVAQAFTQREVHDLRDRAGISYAGYHRHFGHRFVLAGEKRSHVESNLS